MLTHNTTAEQVHDHLPILSALYCRFGYSRGEVGAVQMNLLVWCFPTRINKAQCKQLLVHEVHLSISNWQRMSGIFAVLTTKMMNPCSPTAAAAWL